MSRKLSHSSGKDVMETGNHGLFLPFYLQQTSGTGRDLKKKVIKMSFVPLNILIPSGLASNPQSIELAGSIGKSW